MVMYLVSVALMRRVVIRQRLSSFYNAETPFK